MYGEHAMCKEHILCIKNTVYKHILCIENALYIERNFILILSYTRARAHGLSLDLSLLKGKKEVVKLFDTCLNLNPKQNLKKPNFTKNRRSTYSTKACTEVEQGSSKS
jgi:hypothetical protein